MAPILSKLYHDGYMRAVSVEQTSVFEAAILFAKNETILPAPESAHAIYGAIQQALECRESGEAKTILFGLSGTGYFDMTAYQQYMDGSMSDQVPTDDDLRKSIDKLPKIPGISE
jgi:tryptophan synthase beta chain